MNYPILYRKRIIPDECVLLKDDEILFYEDHILVTKWNTLKPKKDLDHGFSCYFFDEGYKISKFYDREHRLLYYYCDIIDSEMRPEEVGASAPDRNGGKAAHLPERLFGNHYRWRCLPSQKRVC